MPKCDQVTSIPIIYQGGSYGTYLGWVLNMLFTDDQLHDPFDEKTGNSHNANKIDVIYIEKWMDDKSCHPAVPFPLVHPKTDVSMSLEENVTDLTSYFGKSILIYPTNKTYLLYANNYVYKIWDDLWKGPFFYIDKNNLYDNFPVDPETPLEDVEPWIIREWLSYNFFDATDISLEWFLPKHYVNKNCLIIFIDDILYNLESTVAKIKNFINMPLTKNIDCILPYHQKNISLQKFIKQDELADKIVTAIQEKDKSLSWQQNQLSIITEAWIQRWIRNAGYNLKCHGLNRFPTTSKELIRLLNNNEDTA